MIENSLKTIKKKKHKKSKKTEGENTDVAKIEETIKEKNN